MERFKSLDSCRAVSVLYNLLHLTFNCSLQGKHCINACMCDGFHYTRLDFYKLK